MHPVGVAPKAPNNFLKLFGVLCCMDLLLVIFRWGHFLVHPVGVAPKAPSNFLKLLGVLCCRSLPLLTFFMCQEACKLGTAHVKLHGEYEVLKKQHAEDNGKVTFSRRN